MIITERARAFYNWGRWVAECPRDACANAMSLQPNQSVFHCPSEREGCGMLAEVEWPPNPDEIERVLSERPVPRTRNWYPKNHEQAVLSGSPHGQSVADLEEETREYMNADEG